MSSDSHTHCVLCARGIALRRRHGRLRQVGQVRGGARRRERRALSAGAALGRRRHRRRRRYGPDGPDARRGHAEPARRDRRRAAAAPRGGDRLARARVRVLRARRGAERRRLPVQPGRRGLVLVLPPREQAPRDPARPLPAAPRAAPQRQGAVLRRGPRLRAVLRRGRRPLLGPAAAEAVLRVPRGELLRPRLPAPRPRRAQGRLPPGRRAARGRAPRDGRAAPRRAGKESDMPNFKGSYLGRFSLVSADFWTSDHLSERSRSVDAFFLERARAEHSR